MENILNKQKEFFKTGKTLNLEFRLNSLKKLKANIIAKEKEILEALNIDLGKSETESYMCEVGLTLSEISYFLKNLRKFAKDKVVHTPLTNFHSKRDLKKDFLKWLRYIIILRNAAGVRSAW